MRFFGSVVLLAVILVLHENVQHANAALTFGQSIAKAFDNLFRPRSKEEIAAQNRIQEEQKKRPAGEKQDKEDAVCSERWERKTKKCFQKCQPIAFKVMEACRKQYCGTIQNFAQCFKTELVRTHKMPVEKVNKINQDERSRKEFLAPFFRIEEECGDCVESCRVRDQQCESPKNKVYQPCKTDKNCILKEMISCQDRCFPRCQKC